MFDPKDPNRIINYRPLLFAAVGFIMGLASYEALSSLQLKTLFFVISLVIAAALAGFVLLTAIKRGSTPFIVLVAAFLLGFARMAAASPDVIAEGQYTIEGTVCSVSDKDKSVVILTDARIGGERLAYKVKADLNGGTASIGDKLQMVCNAANPSRRFGSYDERLTLLSSGVSVTAKTESYSVIERGRLPIARKLCEIRSLLLERIRYLFADEADAAAGFLLGSKSELDEDETESFKTTGTAHLLSLSGFHVALLTAVILFVLPKRYPVLRTVLAGLFLLFYCAVAAFPPSLVRASVMCMAVLLADVLMKQRDALSSLSLAAIVILAVSPYKLWSAGFMLSFAAVLGILIASGAGQTRTKSPVSDYLAGLIVATIGATAATSLISARAFGYFPTYSLFANLVAVPVFSVAVTLSFVVLLIGVPLPAVAAPLAFVPRIMIRGAMNILARISELPYARLAVVRPSLLSSFVLILMLFVLSPYVLRSLRKRVLIALPLFFLFTASLAADIIKA